MVQGLRHLFALLSVNPGSTPETHSSRALLLPLLGVIPGTPLSIAKVNAWHCRVD